MPGPGGDPDSMSATDVAGPNLVASGTGQMIGDAAFVRTETEASRQAFPRAGKLAGVRAVEVHAEALTNLVPDDLHEHSFVIQQELRRIKRGHPVASGDLFRQLGIQIINTLVCWR